MCLHFISLPYLIQLETKNLPTMCMFCCTSPTKWKTCEDGKRGQQCHLETVSSRKLKRA